jgi:acyl carrier protein
MQSYENMLHKIFEILRAFVPDGQAITEDTNLVAELGLDSLKVMKILETMEDELDISIPVNILPDVHTVKDLITHIQKLTGKEQ